MIVIIIENTKLPCYLWIKSKVFFFFILEKGEFSNRLERQNEWYPREETRFYFEKKKGKDCYGSLRKSLNSLWWIFK